MRLLRPTLLLPVVLAAALAGCGNAEVGVSPATRATLAPVTGETGEAAYSFFFEDTDGTQMEGTGAFRGGAAPVTKIHFDQLNVEGEMMTGITYLRAADRIFTRYDEVIKMIPLMADRWVEASEAQMGPDSEYVSLFFGHAGMADPQQQRIMLEASPSTLVDQETVNGVATTHWTSTPTMNDLVASPLSRDLLDALNDPSLGGDLNQPAKLDAWVDSDGHVRRFELTGLGEEAGMAFRTTSSFDVSQVSDLGRPAREDVIDYDDFKRLGDLGRKIGAGKATLIEVREFTKLTSQLRLHGLVGAGKPVRAT